MTDPLDPLYKQNRDYRAQHDSTFWILSDANGWGLACNEQVYRIWSAFDGRPTREVIANVSAQIRVSAAFVESTAKVLARAGMLIPSQPLTPVAHVPSNDISDLGPFPLVSIIILASRQAREHLETCLPSVLGQTYPNLEVILVDNQTTDDSAAFTQREFPQVKVLSTPKPMWFSDANNYAMKQAQGEFFFLVNEDTELEPDCIAECVRVMTRSDRVAVVAPKMKLFYMRAFYNSMGNSVQADGNAHDNFIGYLDVGQFDGTDQVFAACFGAAMLRRSVLKEIGYMDEEFPIYYSDTDWSFRARICGYEVVAAPKAVVYHKFNATVGTMASTFKLGLVNYARLRFAWKNLDFRRACKIAWLHFKGDLGGFLWARHQGMDEAAATFVKSRLQWVRAWPKTLKARWQTRRLRRLPFSDSGAAALTEGIPRPAMWGAYPVLSTPFIRDHYMRLEPFKPESPPAAEDLVVTGWPMPPPVKNQLKGAWRVLRQQGPRGFVTETRNYVLWRIKPK